MTVHAVEFERVSRLRRRVAGIVALAVLAGAGVWLTLPFGIVQVLRGEAVGWALVAAGAALAAGCAAAIVAAIRTGRAVAPRSLPGKPNPGYEETGASPDPRPGAAWAGSMLGS